MSRTPRPGGSLRRKTPPGALRRAVGRIEAAGGGEKPHLPLGIPEIDGALPGGGLRRGCVHEVGGDAAATGFCAVVLARAGASGGSLLWLAADGGPYPPGLVRYGIEPGRLVVVSGLRRPGDVAWALEEALRRTAVKGVVAESAPLGAAASRRLMLAAEGSDVVGLVLALGVRKGAAAVPTTASRWWIASVPGSPPARTANGQPERERLRGRGPVQPQIGRTAWRAELLHCRGGRPREWTVGPADVTT